MLPTRWDLIRDVKAIPLIDHLVEEVAKLFARDLSTWPPEVEHAEGPEADALRPLLVEHPLAPDERFYRAAFTLARMDVGREVEAYDDYVRNKRWLEAGLAPGDRGLLLFLSRFMTEQLLALTEYTEGRLTRPLLLEVLERTEQHFFRRLIL